MFNRLCVKACPPSRIVVVDNGSRDSSSDNLQRSVDGLEVIRNSCNAGFAKAVNQGIKQALAEPSPSEFILLLNNDAQLEPGALQAFANGFDSLPKLVIAGGQLHYPDGRLQSAFAPLPSLAEEILPLFLLKLISPDRFCRKTLSDSPIAVECVLGACLCVRSSVLPRLGFLDEDYFFFFEEIEWCQRARRLGAEVYYLPDARAIHGGGQTANRFRGPSRVEYQRSKLIFFRKTQSSAAYLSLSVFLVFRTFINAFPRRWPSRGRLQATLFSQSTSSTHRPAPTGIFSVGISRCGRPPWDCRTSALVKRHRENAAR